MKTTYIRKWHLLYLIALFSVCMPLTAQTAILTSGGSANGSGGFASYSIGQIAYTAINSSSGSANQGVQQPIEFYILETNDFLDGTFQINTYPNPTSDELQLSIDNLSSNNLSYHLYDNLGRILIDQKIDKLETIISIRQLPAAVYFLKIMDRNRILKTIKIIKT